LDCIYGLFGRFGSDNHDVMTKLAGAKVLLVDDNDMNQELALELLQNAGMQVVLMDCQMPVMDGYTATREIRKNPLFKDLPIVTMPANAMAGDREKVIEAGMWDHIPKPLNVGDMFATIAKWIKPKGVKGTESATNSGAAYASSTGSTAIIGINSGDVFHILKQCESLTNVLASVAQGGVTRYQEMELKM
jgi:two-component system sensor histidine kinase/response regulator